MDPFCYLCFVVIFLLGKGWPFGSLVCVFSCVSPVLCPGSGVVLGFMDS